MALGSDPHLISVVKYEKCALQSKVVLDATSSRGDHILYWQLAPSSVTDALQLQCDHRRVYMATFIEAAERRLSRQYVRQWQSTFATAHRYSVGFTVYEL